jgi:hypothetical protein
MDDELAELRQQIADLAELTVTMRHRANLPRFRQEWNEDLEAEERLVARIEQWMQSSRETGRALATIEPGAHEAEEQRDEYQSAVEAARGRRPPEPVHSPRSRA